MGNLAEVCSLDLGLNPRQGAAEGLFGGGVDHFGLYTSMSWNAKGTEEQDLTLTGASSGDQVKKQILDLSKSV